MELKEKLLAPYSQNAKNDFISTYNHNLGYQILETDEALEAWGYTQDEIEQQEKERIKLLFLTATDVERALYKSRKIDFDDVIFLVEQYNKKINDKKQEYLDELEKYNALEDEKKQELEQPTEPKEELIDIKALKIELKANNFYRGNPYIEKIGTLLGYSSDELDYLFKNGELPKEEETPTTEENSEVAEENLTDEEEAKE